MHSVITVQLISSGRSGRLRALAEPVVCTSGTRWQTAWHSWDGHLKQATSPACWHHRSKEVC